MPREMSESESSDRAGESALSGRRKPEPGWCILEEEREMERNLVNHKKQNKYLRKLCEKL